MKRGILGSLVGVGLGLAVAGSALANGDPTAGKWKFDTCLGCHGVAGYDNAYPNKSGARKHPTMHAQASSLSKQDIEDIAAYLSQLGNGKGEGGSGTGK